MERETKRAALSGLAACGIPLAVVLATIALFSLSVPSCDLELDLDLDFGFGGLDFSDCQQDLHDAARRWNVADAQRLLDGGADPSSRDASDNTALGCALAAEHLAASGGTTEGTVPAPGVAPVVRLLLEAGADPDGPTGPGPYMERPLGLAIRRGHPDAARLLLDHGADPSLEDCRGTPLVAATRDRSLVVALLDAGADPSGIGGESPMVEAARRGDLDLLQLLEARGGQLDGESRYPGLTHYDEALAASAVGLNPAVTRELLAAGLPIAPDMRLRLLDKAVAGFNPENVQALLDHGLDPDTGVASDTELEALNDASALAASAAGAAAPHTSPAVLAALRDAYPEPPGTATGTWPSPTVDQGLAECDDPGWLSPVTVGASAGPAAAPDALVRPLPPIAVALLGRSHDDLTVLLDAGADANVLIEDAYRPLELAALDCDEEAVRLLLDHDADPTLGEPGHRAVDLACPGLASLLDA